MAPSVGTAMKNESGHVGVTSHVSAPPVEHDNDVTRLLLAFEFRPPGR